MHKSVALQRYLRRHTETGLPSHRFEQPHWLQVVIIPAYRESPALLKILEQMPAASGHTLIILVLNRPDTDCDLQANAELRMALQSGTLPQAQRGSVAVKCLNEHTDLYLHDIELLCGPTPAALGVGLARKSGCDLALQWMVAGGISGQWLCCTDADANVPQDYFEQLDSASVDAVAAIFPFQHMPGETQGCNSATALYELRLNHYVLGLEYAGSPYAYHTLGSCIAIRANAYVKVRGFPKRAGAEDFYMLNKLAKIGPISRLSGQRIQLQSRHSSRVPFGTGPAVAAIIAAGLPEDAPVFDHPRCFEALQALLASLPELTQSPEAALAPLFVRQGLDATVAKQSDAALQALGIRSGLAHCQRQSTSSAQFQRQFHQWFDAFRTLKFIHLMSDAGWEQQSLAQLKALQSTFWPAGQAASAQHRATAPQPAPSELRLTAVAGQQTNAHGPLGRPIKSSLHASE